MKKYAVNLASKHHRLLKKGEQPLPNEKIVEADNDGWIRWLGGNTPLSREQRVECKMINGNPTTGLACEFPWSSCSPTHRVTHYRPLPVPQKRKWNGPQDGLPPIGTRCMYKGSLSKRVGEITHHLRNGSTAIIEYDGGGWDNGMRMNFCPLQSPREQWVEQATNVAKPEHESPSDYLEALYDAMLSGDLPTPGTEQ